MNLPTIGRVVTYRTDGRNGLVYDLPAIVNCTPETHPGDYPDGRSNPLPVPEEGHVHLTVFTPGGFGTKVVQNEGFDDEHIDPEPSSEAFVGADVLVPGSGTYVELDVPFIGASPGDTADHRTARWPERA